MWDQEVELIPRVVNSTIVKYRGDGGFKPNSELIAVDQFRFLRFFEATNASEAEEVDTMIG